MTETSAARAGYIALAILTVVWGTNWIIMKLALRAADPMAFNVQRTWLAALVLVGVLLARRGRLLPASWMAIAVTGFFQTTVNFGATTMALSGGGAGRTSVLVFTMPFWTLLMAWPILGERVRGSEWAAVLLAFTGLVLVVEPWRWEGDLAPKLWGVLSGFGWAGGTVATKYYQRRFPSDPLNFVAWQMVVGVLPLTALLLVADVPPTHWSAGQLVMTFYVGAVSTALGFVMWLAVLERLPAGTASLNTFAVPVIALLASMAIFGERLSPNEWLGIGAIGAGLVILTIRALRARTDALQAPLPLEGG